MGVVLYHRSDDEEASGDYIEYASSSLAFMAPYFRFANLPLNGDFKISLRAGNGIDRAVYKIDESTRQSVIFSESVEEGDDIIGFHKTTTVLKFDPVLRVTEDERVQTPFFGLSVLIILILFGMQKLGYLNFIKNYTKAYSSKKKKATAEENGLSFLPSNFRNKKKS